MMEGRQEISQLPRRQPCGYGCVEDEHGIITQREQVEPVKDAVGLIVQKPMLRLGFLQQLVQSFVDTACANFEPADRHCCQQTVLLVRPPWRREQPIE